MSGTANTDFDAPMEEAGEHPASIRGSYNTIKRTPQSSLRYSTRLMLSFALTAVMTAAILVAVLSFVWEGQFQSYTRQNMQRVATSTAETLSSHYAEVGEWTPEVIANVTAASALSDDIGVQLVDAEGIILYDDTWAITTACDDYIPLLQLVNWLYSEEGQFMYNWGEEGVSFEYGPDGEPHWTDLIINNPDGLSYMFATYKYASGQATTFFPGVFDMEKGFYDPKPGQLEALDTLSELTDGAWIIDRGVQIPLELQTEYASLTTEMSTYADGEILKFILGDRDLSTYDDFLSTVESMGLDRMTEIQQIAYDTYMERLG